MFPIASFPAVPVRRVALLAGFLATAAFSAAAKQPQPVSIWTHTERVCTGPASCVFVATGAIVDGGTVTLDSVNATALPSPTVGTAHYVKTFHGVAGTLTIKLESMITGTSDPLLWNEKGNWIIVSGTGAYAQLLGEGKETGTRDFGNQSLDAVYTGQVH